MTVLGGEFRFGSTIQTSGWTLDSAGNSSTSPSNLRIFPSDRIVFDSPFSTKPTVILSVYSLEADLYDAQHSLPVPKIRYSILPTGVDEAGFNIEIKVWDATRFYFISGAWFAYNSNKIDIV
jgi:H-type lectin domain